MSDCTENNHTNKMALRRILSLAKWTVLLLLGTILFLLLSQTLPIVGSLSNNLWGKAGLLLSGGMAALGLYAIWVRVLERRKASELSLKSLPDLLTGFLIGGLFIASVIGILALLGIYRIDAIETDWNSILLNFTAFFIVAASEEIIFRGILFRMIDERFNATSALIISSLLFGFAHLATVDVWTVMAISVEGGFMLAAAYRLKRNLWFPIGIHWAWNFALGPLFGVTVSGEAQETCFILPEVTGPYLLTGGENGFEGSIVTLILGFTLGIAMWIKRKEQ